MGLNEDEKKLLQELTDRANAPDDDDDFEVEIYDTAAGKGARVPYKSAKGWLHEVFGMGAAPESTEGAGGAEGAGDGKTPPDGKSGDPGAGGKRTPGYFGRQGA